MAVVGQQSATRETGPAAQGLSRLQSGRLGLRILAESSSQDCVTEGPVSWLALVGTMVSSSRQPTGLATWSLTAWHLFCLQGQPVHRWGHPARQRVERDSDRAVGEAVVASGASTVAQQMLSQPTGLAWE